MAIYKLKDICLKIGSGATPRGGKEAYCDEGISLIRSQNVLDFTFSYDGLAHINDQQAEKLNNVEVKPQDILLNITGDSVARVCRVDPRVLPARVNQHVAIIRPDENKVLSSYILFFLQTIKPYLLQIAAGGATRNALTKSMIENLELEVPDILLQKKIVSVLDDIQEKIRDNNEINKNLEQQAQAYFDELFVVNADPNWSECTLSDIGSVVAGGTPSKSKPEYYADQGIAWITPKDLSVNKSKFISHGENDISELGFSKSSTAKMPAGTILFSSRAPIGYIAIAQNEVTTNQGFKSVIPNENVSTAYMYFLLKNLLPTIEGMASGSTFKEISGAAMKSVPTVMPDADTIQLFSSFCEPVFKEQEILEAENQRLSALRDSLLPKLMSGELDVSNIEL